MTRTDIVLAKLDQFAKDARLHAPFENLTASDLDEIEKHLTSIAIICCNAMSEQEED